MSWYEKGRVDEISYITQQIQKSGNSLDELYPQFISKYLSSLGVNKRQIEFFRNSNPTTWSVIIVSHNLPPWMCIKQTYFMMPLLIPSPKQLENDIMYTFTPQLMNLRIYKLMV